MNILITGRNGFIGKELSEFFTKIGHTVFSTCRKTLDVSKEDEVNAFSKYKVDVVLHTAIKGGRRNQTDTMANLLENLKMFNNLHNQADSYKLMISFGSGAEKNLDNFYGVAKNAIAKEIENHDGNIINMRLFGCFGPSESNDRFMKNSFLRVFNDQPIIVHQDKYMDYFYIEDLKNVVLYYMENYNETLPKTLDLCYEGASTLVEIAEKIKKLTNSQLGVIVENKEMGIPYVGEASTLSDLKIGFNGLQRGIERMFDELKVTNG